MKQLCVAFKELSPNNYRERENGGGHVMYYMIHATDHDEAPKLMRRAYEQAIWTTKPAEQLGFQFA